jgi:hypothetical protein
MARERSPKGVTTQVGVGYDRPQQNFVQNYLIFCTQLAVPFYQRIYHSDCIVCFYSFVFNL